MKQFVSFDGTSQIFDSSSDDGVVIYVPRFREYGLLVPDGGTSVIEIRFCPFCGKRLPDSLRDEWYTTIENMAIDPNYGNIPIAYRDEKWWIGDAPNQSLHQSP